MDTYTHIYMDTHAHFVCMLMCMHPPYIQLCVSQESLIVMYQVLSAITLLLTHEGNHKQSIIACGADDYFRCMHCYYMYYE